MYYRLITNELVDFINEKIEHKNVLILLGPRQVGKTTTLQALLQNKPHLFINFEKNPSYAEQIDLCNDFGEFENYLKEVHHFNPTEQILIIDEAQQSLKLGSFVRFMKEEWNNATVILTGSTISELYSQTKRQPVGRESFIEMGPMSFLEFLMALQQDSLVKVIQNYQIGQTITQSQHSRFIELFETYLMVGGLPEVVTYFKDKKDYQRLRSDIYKTYEQDFIRYFSLEDVNLFKRCMEATATHVGSPSKDSQAIQVDAPGYKKVSGIFARLEKWRLIIKCEQLGLEPEKNYFYPKRYLYDVGILTDLRLKGLTNIHLTDISSPVLRTPLGGIIENALAISLKRQFQDNFFGIKISSRAEIDFGIKHNHVVYPIECKISLRFKQNFTFGIREYFKKTNRSSYGFIFYGGTPLFEKDNPLITLPFYLVDGLKNMLTK